MGSCVGCLERVIELWVPEMRGVSWTSFSGAVPWRLCLKGLHEPPVTQSSFSGACGRDIAQAVSRWIPSTEARVRAHVRSCGICGGQSGTEAGFLRVLRFSLPILTTPTAPHSSSSIIRGWYNRPNGGRRAKWNQSHPTPKNYKKETSDAVGGLCTLRCCIISGRWETSNRLVAKWNSKPI
jgi:hypothetical protein